MERGGVKGAQRPPQVYRLLLLSRVIAVKYGGFPFFYLFIKPWGFLLSPLQGFLTLFIFYTFAFKKKCMRSLHA